MLRPRWSYPPVLVVLAAALAFHGAGPASWIPSLAAQETSTRETPPLGALEEGLERLAEGKLDVAREIFERAEAPGVERMQWLLAELAEYYRLNEVFEGKRVTFTEGGVTFRRSSSDPKVPSRERLQEARGLVRALAEQEAPDPSEVRAVTSWTRRQLQAQGSDTPKLVRLLHCHVRMLSGEADGTARPEEGTQVKTLTGSSIRAPERIFDPRPGYTPEARKSRIQGIIITQATIDAEGCVQDAKTLKGLPKGLSESALETMRWWVFRPAQLEGEPVAVYYNITMNFTLQ